MKIRGEIDMKIYKREYPLFSLCGLNCGLCPRYQIKGESKCPGCGGQDFNLKHPTCTVITCNKRHDQVEYCFQCSSFLCTKYSNPSNVDSFISYRNVISDFEKADRGLQQYRIELDEKVKILELLINNYNDGKRKKFYCIAVNLLKLKDLKDIVVEIHDKLNKPDISMKDKIEQIVILFEAVAKRDNIDLKLRK